MSDIKPPNKSRRHFLFSAVGVTGALIVGWGILPPRQRLNRAQPWPVKKGEIALNGWVKIATDGTVTVAMPRSEMGQGVYTALPMLVAEEMDVELATVNIEQAPVDKIFGNVAVMTDSLPFHPDDHGALKHCAEWLLSKTARELGIMVTGGSSSVKDAWQPMRYAGAVARALLVRVAAKEWHVDASECTVSNGVIHHPNGKQMSYVQASAILSQDPNFNVNDAGTIKLKEPAEFTIIGTAKARRDSAEKVNGSAVFGLDVRLPGMLYAAIKMSPTLDGTVASFDAGTIKNLPGVKQILEIKREAGGRSAVAVVASSYWQARQALGAMSIQWNAGPNVTLSGEVIYKALTHAIENESGFVYHQAGDINAGNGVIKKIQADYFAPFLAHAAMEPINCTAQIKDGKVHVWIPTQVPSIVAGEAAKIASVPADNVTVTVTYLGGGFGRRGEIEMATQALTIAKVTNGAPVQLIWSREDDMTNDVYRPAATARFSAAIDVAGNVVTYDNKSASDSVTHQYMKRVFGLTGAGPDRTTAEGEFDMPYEFPNQRIAHVIVPAAVPVGYWRSVGHSHNAFFKESFIDELAHETGKDPVEFRRGLLKNHPRHLAVLNAAVEKAGTIDSSLTPKRSHGVALHQAFGTIVAQVAEVSVTDNEIRVHKVSCAVDCGIAVNPNIIAQQMESGVIFGLSAALYGEITIKDGKVEQQNFDTYAVIRMSEAPQVDVVIIPSAEPPQGIGEPGTPPIAPAVANAVFNLTGQRLRSLPLKLGRPSA
jgi:isoquinoline 1-oxidoreductase beta subunit